MKLYKEIKMKVLKLGNLMLEATIATY